MCNSLGAHQIYYFKPMQVIYKQTFYRIAEVFIQHYDLRNTKRQTPKVRTNYGKQNFNYKVPSLLNIFNEEADFSLPFHQYKNKMHNTIIYNEKV